MKRRGTSRSQPTSRQYACQVPNGATQPPTATLPKKLAYNRPKKPTSEAQTAQNNVAEPTIDSYDSSNAAKTAKSSSEGNSAPRFLENNSIFGTSPRTYTEIAADVVRADCMNHGYKIERTIGEGAYAKVKLAEVLPSKLARNPIMADIAQENDGTLQVAIKVIENKNVPKEFLKKFLPRELGNHCPLPSHMNVVRVFEQFKTPNRIYVVMEYCSKGDLLDLINQKISESCKGLGEELARKLFRMMTEGVHHIHHNGIVHRDLKCENILVDGHDTIKITDFGFSTRFEPGKSSFLKTSCGSYAYTAPEVIKMKPYDGTKSDAWSLGIILFAMLNGRLPFNDAQLSELEEDMKMQRLKFERAVSFDAMVLVRRILQYTASSRPSTDEILSDPWLTGERLIPRQQNKPRWINPYQARKEEGDVNDPAVPGSNPVYYKGTIPEREPQATITLNHEKKETVILKSRAGNKKNIWTSGPATPHRPNTWPRSEKNKVDAKSKAGSRGSSAGGKNTKTTVVVRPPNAYAPQKKHQKAKVDSPARVSSKTIRLSKWFMEKYMYANEGQQKPDTSTACGGCKAEMAIASTHAASSGKDDSSELEEEGCLVDPDMLSEYLDFEDFRFPSPVNNEPDLRPDVPSFLEKSTAKQDSQPDPAADTPMTSTRPEARICTSAGPVPVSRRKVIIDRKPVAKSANVRLGPAKKDTTKTAPASQAPNPSKKNLVTYMVKPSTSPAERVKYFRDRLMKLYGKPRVIQDSPNGFPTLMVQALKPPTSKPPSPEQVSQHPPSFTRHGGARARRPRVGSSGATVKPVQRVVVHSSML